MAILQMSKHNLQVSAVVCLHPDPKPETLNPKP